MPKHEMHQPISKICHPKFHVHHPKYPNPSPRERLGASWKKKKKEGPSGQRAARRLTDGFHLRDIENTPPVQNTTQEILRKSEAHQMLAQSLGRPHTKPRSLGHKAWVSAAQSWGWVSHKAGSLGSPAPGWVHCAPWADQEQAAILWLPRGVFLGPVGRGYVAP